MEDNAFLQFTLMPKACSLAPQSKSCFNRDPVGVDPMGGDPVKGSTWCETCMCLYRTISQVSSLTTGLGDERETSPPAVLEESDPLESNPLFAFAKVSQVFCSGTNKTLYLSQINVFQSSKEEKIKYFWVTLKLHCLKIGSLPGPVCRSQSKALLI